MSGIKSTIAKRIKKARTYRKISQDELIKEINEDAQRPKEKKSGYPKNLEKETYRRWEDGTNGVNLDWIPTICKHLWCDVGYLFGYYEEFTKEDADVCSSTGLSLDASRFLAVAAESKFPSDIEFLSYSRIISLILSDPAFYEMIDMVHKISCQRLNILMNQVRTEFATPIKKDEYLSLYSNARTDIERLKGIVETFGCSVVSDEELLLAYQFRFRQSMENVVSNTLNVVNADISEHFEKIKKDFLKNYVASKQPR